MNTLRQQRTLARPVSVTGFGYWSSRDVQVEFRPAEPDTGVTFVRGDFDPAVRIPARVEYRYEAPRRTALRHQTASVEMIEHIMAALYGLGIDNCEVWVDEPEMPGCDGSSQAFVDALNQAGLVEQQPVRPRLIVRDTVRVGDDENWIEASPAPRGGLQVRYRLDYGRDNPIGRQTLDLSITPDSFQQELAASRTFLLKAEADWLQGQGLAARCRPTDLLVFGEHGPIENELRFDDECVRHKMLDVVGDLALAGYEIVGRIVAHRSGHRLNAELVRALLAEGEMVGQPRRRSA